jgi:hypothetical protein
MAVREAELAVSLTVVLLTYRLGFTASRHVAYRVDHTNVSLAEFHVVVSGLDTVNVVNQRDSDENGLATVLVCSHDFPSWWID